jgi:acetyl-CoA C-acetyltransferase
MEDFIMHDVVIVSAVRTAIGTFGGALKGLSPMELLQRILREVVERKQIDKQLVKKVIAGSNMCPIDQNIARFAAYREGFPETTTGFTINSTCGSSIQATISAVQSIQCGEADVVIACGVESMSNAPYLMNTARWGQKFKHLTAIDLLWAGMQEPSVGVGMGLTAENLAEKYNISREEQDSFALLSHQRAAKATEKGKFKDEIIPLEIKQSKNKIIMFDKDEHIRSDISLEQLAKLPPAFKEGGTVTAGNACGLNDGAAALVLMTKDRAMELNLKPLAIIKGYDIAGVDPNFMGIGPVPAIRNVLKKSNLQITDIERFEINEAFAAQYLSCERELNLDREKVNINGNGIALGHPLGATGCRLITTLLYGMIADNLKLGIASLCAGGGMGFAVILEQI